jgi:hypothetical protein
MTIKITPNVPELRNITLGVSLIKNCLRKQRIGYFQIVQKLDGYPALPLVTWRRKII